MKVGITFDLRDEYLAEGFDELETAEFDRAETIDAIDDALMSLGHSTDRIGRARQLVERLAQGTRWDLVFNICEGLGSIGREAQVPVLLDLYCIAYTFAGPDVMVACLHKGMTKTIAARAGLRTPDFAVIESLDAFSHEQTKLPHEFPLFVKPVGEGTGKGVSPASIVRDDCQLASACASVLEAYRQPVLIETYLPGREFTTGVLGTGAEARVLGTIEVLLGDRAEPEVYSYSNKEHWRDRVSYCHLSSDDDPTIAEVEALALKAWLVLGGCDAGRIDIRCDDIGRPNLLEVNPLAGLHPTHSDLPIIATAAGISYTTLISSIVDSAMAKAGTAARVASPSSFH